MKYSLILAFLISTQSFAQDTAVDVEQLAYDQSRAAVQTLLFAQQAIQVQFNEQQLVAVNSANAGDFAVWMDVTSRLSSGATQDYHCLSYFSAIRTKLILVDTACNLIK